MEIHNRTSPLFWNVCPKRFMQTDRRFDYWKTTVTPVACFGVALRKVWKNLRSQQQPSFLPRWRICWIFRFSTTLWWLWFPLKDWYLGCPYGKTWGRWEEHGGESMRFSWWRSGILGPGGALWITQLAEKHVSELPAGHEPFDIHTYTIFFIYTLNYLGSEVVNPKVWT